MVVAPTVVDRKMTVLDETATIQNRPLLRELLAAARPYLTAAVRGRKFDPLNPLKALVLVSLEDRLMWFYVKIFKEVSVRLVKMGAEGQELFVTFNSECIGVFEQDLGGDLEKASVEALAEFMATWRISNRICIPN